MSEANDAGSATAELEKLMKGMRDANLDAWSKVMTNLVNSEAYSESSAQMLNAWLASTSPARQVIENTISQALKGTNVASVDDVIRLSDRLTNIEMRLDDIDAKLDETLSKHQQNGESS